MSIRKPSANLKTPNTIILKKGSLLERVHDRNYAANSFNPCQGSATRFAPIQDTNGNCVDSLYAGSTLESAIYETIFHDVPTKAKFKTVPKSLVQSRAHGQLEVQKSLTLASLREPDLKLWRVSRKSLITTSPKLYAETAEWAEAIHHQFSNIDGLVWTSNQCDPDSAYLLFGDRVSAADLKIITSRDGQTDPSFLADVRSTGQRTGIRITI